VWDDVLATPMHDMLITKEGGCASRWSRQEMSVELNAHLRLDVTLLLAMVVNIYIKVSQSVISCHDSLLRNDCDNQNW